MPNRDQDNQFSSQTKPSPAGCTHSEGYLQEVVSIALSLDTLRIERIAVMLKELRERGGRLFFLGVGGSAANCSHAVNDFRKLTGIEAYTPSDNISELTARVNDDGWETVFSEWLRVSRLAPKDLIFVLSVGGGDVEKNVSPNIVQALKYAAEVGAFITGIVSRNGGYTALAAEECIIVPIVNSRHTTPHAEAFQSIILHLLVSHPALNARKDKWQSLT